MNVQSYGLRIGFARREMIDDKGGAGWSDYIFTRPWRITRLISSDHDITCKFSQSVVQGTLFKRPCHHLLMNYLVSWVRFPTALLVFAR